nr:hypothetical protein [Lusitaniella coriacea]
MLVALLSIEGDGILLKSETFTLLFFESGWKGRDRATHPDPFVQRLVTYLQASQYKLLKAYRSIPPKSRKSASCA